MTSKNKALYVYVSCLSDIYFLDEYDEEITSRVCPMCGDSDDYVGSFDNVEDLVKEACYDDWYCFREDYVRESWNEHVKNSAGINLADHYNEKNIELSEERIEELLLVYVDQHSNSHEAGG